MGRVDPFKAVSRNSFGPTWKKLQKEVKTGFARHSGRTRVASSDCFMHGHWKTKNPHVETQLRTISCNSEIEVGNFDGGPFAEYPE